MAETNSAVINNLLENVNETAAMETDYLICPPCVANATVVKWDFASGTRKENNGETETPWYSITFQWDVDNQEAREYTKRDKVLVNQNPIFLRFLPNNSLDPDNNQQFARLAKLFDIQMEGVTNKAIFDSFIGQYALVEVQHRAFKRANGEDGVSANVVRVAAPE